MEIEYPEDNSIYTYIKRDVVVQISHQYGIVTGYAIDECQCLSYMIMFQENKTVCVPDYQVKCIVPFDDLDDGFHQTDNPSDYGLFTKWRYGDVVTVLSFNGNRLNTRHHGQIVWMGFDGDVTFKIGIALEGQDMIFGDNGVHFDKKLYSVADKCGLFVTADCIGPDDRQINYLMDCNWNYLSTNYIKITEPYKYGIHTYIAKGAPVRLPNAQGLTGIVETYLLDRLNNLHYEISIDGKVLVCCSDQDVKCIVNLGKKPFKKIENPKKYGIITKWHYENYVKINSHTGPKYGRIVWMGFDGDSTYKIGIALDGPDYEIGDNGIHFGMKLYNVADRCGLFVTADRIGEPDNLKRKLDENNEQNSESKQAEKFHLPDEFELYLKKRKNIFLYSDDVNCYVTCTLQALSGCDLLLKDMANLHNRFQSCSKVSSFHKVLETIVSDLPENVDVSKFSISWNWGKRGVQDCFEFLSYLMNTMFNEIRKCLEKSQQIKFGCLEDWIQIRLPMRVTLKYEIVCDCGCVNSSPDQTDLALHLSLQSCIYNDSCLGLQDLIEHFFMKEPILGYECDNVECLGRNTVWRQARFSRSPPDTVCIHLQRTFWNGFTMVKIPNYVPFCKTIIMKSDYFAGGIVSTNAENSQDIKYVLKSLIVHNGVADDGHYICYKLSDGVWYSVNDAELIAVNEEQIYSNDVYIFFYERLVE